MSLMSLLQFGSQTLLSEAIRAEITQSLERGFYQHSESKKDLKGYRHGTRKTTLDTPIGLIFPQKNGHKIHAASAKVSYSAGLM